jgi:hypothetical protein
MLPYWMVLRTDSLRQPSVAAVADALRSQTAAFERALAGRSGYRADQPPSMV